MLSMVSLSYELYWKSRLEKYSSNNKFIYDLTSSISGNYRITVDSYHVSNNGYEYPNKRNKKYLKKLPTVKQLV